MNKKQIWLLSIFISAITLALIVVQVLWIADTRESKKRDFDSAVSIAMERVLDAISHEETYTLVVSQLPNNLPTTEVPDKDNSTNYSERQTSRDGVKYTTRSHELIPYSQLDSFTTQNKTMPYLNDTDVIEFFKKGTNGAGNSATPNIDRNVTSAKSIIVEQIVEHIFLIDLPIEQRVTLKQVDTLMRNELIKSNITAPFEIAIISEQGHTLVNSPHYFSKEKDKQIFAKTLFPNDPDSSEKYNLNLFFPEQNFYILQSLFVLISASFILTLLILATFIATLLIIAKQKKTAEIRNAFVSNITHEFKTPIAIISLAAQMLRDENIPVTAKNIPNLSGMVVTQSKKLTFLVEQVLQMSIFNKGDYELKKVSLDVHEVIKKVLASFSLQTQSVKANIVCKLNAKNAIIYTDELHYTNIISNLFDNALKYSKGTPSIKIVTVNKDNGILVSLSDNGIGISKEYQKRIFEQFFRVPSGNVHDVKGFGLGLSYVKKIIDVMGGQIWLQSEPEKGSTFFVWIPLKSKT